MIPVTLTEVEYVKAVTVAAMRHYRSQARKSEPSFEQSAEQSLLCHVLGAVGEACVSKFLGQVYEGTVDTFVSAADLNVRSVQIEVRATTREGFNKIKKNQKPDGIVVFTQGRNMGARGVGIKGWIKASDGMQEQWLDNPGGFAEVFVVPNKRLHRPSELESAIDLQSDMDRLAREGTGRHAPPLTMDGG